MKRPLFLIAGGFVLGEVLSLHDESAVVVFMAAAAAAVLFRAASDKKNSLIFGLLFFFILSGFQRAEVEKGICSREEDLRLDGVRKSVTGKVDSIREQESRTEVIIRPADEDLRYLLIYTDGGDPLIKEQLFIGMSVSVSGRYSLFGRATNPGQFDYRSYYRARKLTYRFFADDIRITERSVNLYDRFRDMLRCMSRYFSGILDTVADPEDAGILKSVLLGDKSGMDEEIRDLYRKNGISHLLAISGLHLSLISTAVYGLLRRAGLGYMKSGFLGGTVLLAYCIMSGASVSSMRALIMLLLGYLAAYKGRTYDLLTALFTAAFLLFLDSPFQLTQSGPQLSFMAVLGIACAADTGFSDNIKKPGIKGRILSALTASVFVQMATAPVILWNFFRFPLYGFIINLFVLPLMGCVVASGAAGMIMGILSPALGRLFLGTAHFILLWYDLLCRAFGRLPGSSLLLGRPSQPQICIYYAALMFLLFLSGSRRKSHGPAALRLVPLLFLLFPLPILGCHILFMDVGQGDGMLIRTREGVVLVDGGSSSVSDLYGERLLPCLESLAVSRIDYAIVSHSHADHTNGLFMLLGDESPVRVDYLILPAGGRGDEEYEKLAERAGDKGTKAFWMKTGDEAVLGKMKLTCLYPDDSGGFPDVDANEHSLLLRLDYKGFSMLMGGDMTVNGERAVLGGASPDPSLLNTQVLKVSHHGSSTSTSGPFIDAVSPEWAVISYGRNNIYGHPDKETLKTLADRHITVYETALDGAVTLRTDGRRIRWHTFTDCDGP